MLRCNLVRTASSGRALYRQQIASRPNCPPGTPNRFSDRPSPILSGAGAEPDITPGRLVLLPPRTFNRGYHYLLYTLKIANGIGLGLELVSFTFSLSSGTKRGKSRRNVLEDTFQLSTIRRLPDGTSRPCRYTYTTLCSFAAPYEDGLDAGKAAAKTVSFA